MNFLKNIRITNRILIISVLFAVIEYIFLSLFQSSKVFTSHSILVFVAQFFVHVFLWVVPLWLYSVGIVFLKLIRNRVLKIVTAIIVIAGLSFYLFCIFIGWLYYFNSGMFLSRSLLLFGLDNLHQLQLHVFQTMLIPVVIINSVVIVLAIGTHKFLQLKVQFRFSKYDSYAVVAVLVVSFISLLFLAVAAPTMLMRTTHPLLAFFVNDNEQNELRHEGNVKELRDMLALKSMPDYSMYDVSAPVIVLMVEAMRADLIYKKHNPIPFMTSLIDHGIFFEKPYATASHSDYADLSVWYSQYPLRSVERFKYRKNDIRRGVSIFEVFKRIGYKTAYISSQNEKWGDMINWLDVPEVDYFYHSEDYDGDTWYNKDDRGGILRLIKSKIATAGKIEDSATFEVAKNWIDSLEPNAPFFIGLNVQNTHFSYVIPEGGPEPFQPSVIDFPTPFMFWSPDKIEHVQNRYFNALYNLDMMIKEFVEYLKAKGIWDECIFVVVGDSGEAFYEHGFGNHGGPMYDEVMKTYCFIKPAHESVQRRITHPVSHVDILPTVLDLLDVPQPSTFQGISAIGNELRKNVYMYSHGLITQYGIVQWPWKFLVGIRPKGNQLFNLEKDPAEQRDLAQNALYAHVEYNLSKILKFWIRLQLLYYTDPDLCRVYAPPKAE